MRYLEDYDFDVSTTQSGEDALDKLEQEAFNIAIVDLRLPGMSGEAFIQESKTLYPELKYLIHTGSAGYEMPEHLIELGIRADHVFFKPMIDLKLLVRLLRSLSDKE